MGEAKRRKKAGLASRPKPIECREVLIFIPKDLAARLEKFCPPSHPMREYIVGVLAAYADWAEAEKKRQESPLILPATQMPTGLVAAGVRG